MGRLIRSEWLKLRTIWVGLLMLAGTLGYTLLQALATILTAGRVEGTFALESSEGVRSVLGAPTRGSYSSWCWGSWRWPGSSATRP